MRPSTNLNFRKLNCVTISHCCALCLKTKRLKRSPLKEIDVEPKNRTICSGVLWGSHLIIILHCCKLCISPLAKGFKSANLSRFWELELCDNFAFGHASPENRKAQVQHSEGDRCGTKKSQTVVAGRLCGAARR